MTRFPWIHRTNSHSSFVLNFCFNPREPLLPEVFKKMYKVHTENEKQLPKHSCLGQLEI